MDAVSNVTGQIHRSDNYEHITHMYVQGVSHLSVRIKILKAD